MEVGCRQEVGGQTSVIIHNSDDFPQVVVKDSLHVVAAVILHC